MYANAATIKTITKSKAQDFAAPCLLFKRLLYKPSVKNTASILLLSRLLV
jgi:hypothetical protein